MPPPKLLVETPALGYFYMIFLGILGLLANFSFLILIFRFIRFITKPVLKLLLAILSSIFSNQNFERLEKAIASQKPRIKKVTKEINFKKMKEIFFGSRQ